MILISKEAMRVRKNKRIPIATVYNFYSTHKHHLPYLDLINIPIYSKGQDGFFLDRIVHRPLNSLMPYLSIYLEK